MDPETGKTVEAKWGDLIEICRDEAESYIKNTKLNHASLYPTNFDKQKDHLVCNIFNEKTSTEIRCRGKIDTALFVKAVTNDISDGVRSTKLEMSFLPFHMISSRGPINRPR